MAIYTTIINKIETILEGVKSDGKLAEIHSNPASKFKAYPVAVFFPVSMENDFETNIENIKTYNFRLYLIATANQSSVNKIYNDVMPNLVDEVLEAFDSGWDLDSIDGHRVWIKLESGNWETSVEDKNMVVYSEFNLQIKVLTNN